MNAGDKITVSLEAGFVLSLTVPSGAIGTLTRLTDSAGGGDPYAPVDLDSADVSVGPFNTSRRYAIDCTVGSIAYAAALADPADKADTSAYAATAAIVNALSALHLYGAGAPVDYTDGTPPASGEGTSPKGSIYSDTTNGFVYRNSGTQAQPIWTKLGDAV